jgi:hypothetical protein
MEIRAASDRGDYKTVFAILFPKAQSEALSQVDDGKGGTTSDPQDMEAALHRSTYAWLVPA